MDYDTSVNFPEVPQSRRPSGGLLDMILRFAGQQRDQNFLRRGQERQEGSIQSINQQQGTPGQDPAYNQSFQTGQLGNQLKQQGLEKGAFDLQAAQQLQQQANDFAQKFMGNMQQFPVEGNPLLAALVKSGFSPQAAEATYNFANPNQLEQGRQQNAVSLEGLRDTNQQNANKLDNREKFDNSIALQDRQLKLQEEARKRVVELLGSATDPIDYLNKGGDIQALPIVQEKFMQEKADKKQAAEDAKLLANQAKQEALGGKSEEQFKRDDDYNRKWGIGPYANEADKAAQEAFKSKQAEQKAAFDDWWNGLFGLYGKPSKLNMIVGKHGTLPGG